MPDDRAAIGELRAKEWRFCARGPAAGACLATDPVQVEPAGATWATACPGFDAEEPPPADVSPGAHQSTGAEPGGASDRPPEPMTPPADATDTLPVL